MLYAQWLFQKEGVDDIRKPVAPRVFAVERRSDLKLKVRVSRVTAAPEGEAPSVRFIFGAVPLPIYLSWEGLVRPNVLGLNVGSEEVFGRNR